MVEIKKLEDLKGKTIIETKQDLGDLWIKFSDDSFAVFVVNDIATEGFGYKKKEVNLYEYGKNKTEHNLVELNIITEEEYEQAVLQKEIENKSYLDEREAKRQEEIKECELNILNNLKDTFNI